MGNSVSANLIYGFILSDGEGDWYIAEYDEKECQVAWPQWLKDAYLALDAEDRTDDDPDLNSDEDVDDFLSSDTAVELMEARLKELLPDYYTPEVARWYYAQGEERERLRELHDRAQAEVGVRFDMYGYEYRNRVLIAGEVRGGYDGKDVDLHELNVKSLDEGWDAKLARAVEHLQITPKEGPRWILVASYG